MTNFPVSPEAPDSAKGKYQGRHSAQRRNGPAKWRALALAAPVAGTLVVSSFISPGKAAASNDGSRAIIAAPLIPVPLAGAKYAGPLVLDDAGAQLARWNQTSSYCSANQGFIGDGTVAVGSSGTVNLTTSGTPGSCVGLISPSTFSSGVIEADIYLPPLPGKPHNVANWPGFWLSGANWPQDGELDAVEVDNSWVQQHIGGAPINSDSKPATFSVKYLRIWSYK